MFAKNPAQKQKLIYQIFYHGYLHHQCVDFKLTCKVQSGKKGIGSTGHMLPTDINTLLLLFGKL